MSRRLSEWLAPPIVWLSLWVPAASVAAPPIILPVPVDLVAVGSHQISGDGTKLAFIAGADPFGQNPDGSAEVFVYDVPSGQLFQITRTGTDPSFAEHSSVRIGHDGTRLAFYSRFALDSGGFSLGGADVFIADVDYVGGAPVGYQRVTTTNERGTIALSGDGTKLALVSRSNLDGGNDEGNVEMFRVNLEPTISVSQLSDTGSGIAFTPWQIELDISHSGDEIVFSSNSLQSPCATEIFTIRSIGVIRRETVTASCGPSSWPSIASFTGHIAFRSDGNFTGDNVDNSEEIFLKTTTIRQITDTPKSGLLVHDNDEPDLAGDGKSIVFTSNRDIVPAGAGAPGNADENREIILARFHPDDSRIPIEYVQLTDTTASTAPFSYGNLAPRVDESGLVVAFNSDLDLGTTDSSLLYVALFDAPPGGAPPVITESSPGAGGPGVAVILTGEHLAGATEVRFGGLSADFTVLSDDRIQAIVPVGITLGAITVVTPFGTAVSSFDFEPATLVTFGEEFNQGIVDYEPVAGKDALVRVFTGVEASALVAHWKVAEADLTITTPSGDTRSVPPTLFDDVLSNWNQSFSERRNVNFYVAGHLLSEPGLHTFRITISDIGGIVHEASFEKSLTPTRDVVLIFQSLARHPNPEEVRIIFEAFDVFSRLHPIRAGLGDLQGAIGASDFEAGLRVAYVNAPLLDETGGPSIFACFPNCWDALLARLNERLVAVNSGGFERTDFSVLFMPRDRMLAAGGGWTDCDNIFELGAFGYGQFPGSASWVQLCNVVGSTLAHEIGHNIGLVPLTAPNSDGFGESVTSFFDRQGFNLRTRRSMSSLGAVMAAPAVGPEDRVFFENDLDGQDADYPFLVSKRPAGASPLSSSSGSRALTSRSARRAGEPAALRLEPFEEHRFVILGTVDASRRVLLRHAYVLGPGGGVTTPDPESPYALAFLDESGRLLAEDRVPVPPMTGADGSADRRSAGLSFLGVVRPFPATTASVELRHEGATIYRLDPGPSAPELDLLAPEVTDGNPGAVLELRWLAADADGDPLSFHAEISRDGGKRFVPLVAATTETRLLLSADGLPGGPEMVVRVTASDGIHQVVRSSGLFELPEHAPIPAITWPREGGGFRPGEPIALRGYAFDFDEGVLGDGASDEQQFVWRVDGRETGRGRFVSVDTPFEPGAHEISLTVQDSRGLTGTDVVDFVVSDDGTPPKTLAVVSPEPNAHGWNRTEVTISLTATDDPEGEGVREIVSLLAGAENRQAVTDDDVARLSVSSEGTTLLTYFAVDEAGNREAPRSLSVRIDRTPPTILGGREPLANEHGWNRTDVSVLFECFDEHSGIAGCGPTPQVVTSERAGQLRRGNAEDRAGHSVHAEVGPIHIDKTAPVVSYRGNSETYTVDDTVEIRCAAEDALSGIDFHSCRDVVGPAYSFSLGENVFSASATDVAGNAGTGSVRFSVKPDITGLAALTERFVTNVGVARSLVVKLNAAAGAMARGSERAAAGALRAYAREVQAQSGTSVTHDQARVLLDLVRSLGIPDGPP